MTPATARAAEHDAAGRHDQAIDELAHATRAGDIEAMTELGKRLVSGDRAPLLPEDGTRFLADALHAGSSEAALRLATMAALVVRDETALRAVRLVLAVFIGTIGYLVRRSNGASRKGALLFGFVTVVVALIIANIKVSLSH